MTLVDTSAWISFLRADGSPADRTVARLLEERAPIRTTDTIVAELLAGAGSEDDARRIGELVDSLDLCAPLAPPDLARAARLFRDARAGGDPVGSMSPCLVAAAALRDDLAVLAADPDYGVLARHGGPRLHPASATTRLARRPAPAARPDPSASPPAGSAQPGPARVLVVEDEASALRILEDALTGPDREIVVATSAREARARIEESVPDVIVLDLFLPDEDGRRVLADLRRTSGAKDTGVVVLTGKTGPRTREECFGLGADWFFYKPFDAVALADAVERLIVEGRSEASEPDPLGTPLTLSEVQRVLSSRRPDGGGSTPWIVGLLELDTDPDGMGTPAESPTGRRGGSMPLLPKLLRTIIVALSDALDPEELVARWGVDELVVVSPSRDDEGMRVLLADIAEIPDVARYLRTRVRSVGRDEDLLDAVSAMAASLVPPPAPPQSLGGRGTGSGSPAEEERRDRPRATLVEDDPVTAGLVRHRLERSGFVVEHHADGAEALAAILEHPPHVVVLDVQLPSMDGFEILARVREDPRAGGVPVLIFTSLGRQEHVQRGFELGADDYVTKPFSPTELLTRVLRLVRRR